MEKQDKIVVHADVNGHFCYSSLLYYPELLDVPVVVGGNEESRHGIVLSKNQAAKKYRIQTGSTLYQARQLCPNLRSLPPSYPLYERTSKDFYRFMRQFSDISAPFGCDGMSIDITGTAHLYGGGPNSIRGVEAIVRELHERFPAEYGLNLSIGISWNFSMAKLACDNAGANGIRWIMRESPEDTAWQSYVYSLPVDALLYVGEKTRNKFWNKGVRTIGDMVECGPEILHSWLGKVGLEHYVRATGQDSTPIVDLDGGPPMRTIGNGSTTPYDLTKEEQVHNMAHVLASSVCKRMRAHRVVPKTVGVVVSFQGPDKIDHESFQCPMRIPSSLDVEFATVALDLFFHKYRMKHPIRKLELRGRNLMFNTSVYQTSMEYNAITREKAMELAACKDDLNGRWRRTVVRGVEMIDPLMTGLGSKPNQQFAPAGWY